MTAYDVVKEIKSCDSVKEDLNSVLQDLYNNGTGTPFMKEAITSAIIKLGKYQTSLEDILKNTNIK